MRFASYWHDTAPAFTGATAGPTDGTWDVAVVGGGFTGLSAARTLAMGGAKVVLLEAGTIGSGASGRNGGHLNNGLAHSFTAAKAHLGPERAVALYRALDASVDHVERTVADEGIACDFKRVGKLKLASKPAHFDAIARNFDVVHREVDPDTALLSRDDLKGEVRSDAFHGAMLSKKSAVMHMGRYATGLAEAAVRRGATIFEKAPVTALRREAGGFVLQTPRGTLTAKEVLVATGAYTTGAFGWFRRRIIPVGSFIVATRPLSDVEVAGALPRERTFVTSMNIGNYFRLSPDRRLIFGGRARFSAVSNQQSDARSGAILRAGLAELFPQLATVDVDYCWGGLVDMTKDRYPRAGRNEDGLWYAMGYSGHGAQMSGYMGATLARAILGQQDDNPLKGLSWPAVPGHLGQPWFLPIVGFYYKMLDRFQ
ncbi:FAD-binding oxidoreductase [uncultured Alsobacter sp.]|uniref:NAD(P)/FAD-dependent oxidoreductase n=1 Tax=uncultured Alsobacter sp. TaxID=1748258 RepID=UPI0025D1EC07|nr:FAD-binding oxidoreductase [uncultured Alsobacter sp.]